MRVVPLYSSSIFRWDCPKTKKHTPISSDKLRATPVIMKLLSEFPISNGQPWTIEIDDHHDDLPPITTYNKYNSYNNVTNAYLFRVKYTYIYIYRIYIYLYINRYITIYYHYIYIHNELILSTTWATSDPLSQTGPGAQYHLEEASYLRR